MLAKIVIAELILIHITSLVVYKCFPLLDKLKRIEFSNSKLLKSDTLEEEGISMLVGKYNPPNMRHRSKDIFEKKWKIISSFCTLIQTMLGHSLEVHNVT